MLMQTSQENTDKAKDNAVHVSNGNLKIADKAKEYAVHISKENLKNEDQYYNSGVTDDLPIV